MQRFQCPECFEEWVSRNRVWSTCDRCLRETGEMTAGSLVAGPGTYQELCADEMTTTMAADLLGFNRQRVRYMAKVGKIPYKRKMVRGKPCVVLKRSDVLAFATSAS